MKKLKGITNFIVIRLMLTLTEILILVLFGIEEFPSFSGLPIEGIGGGWFHIT